MVKKVAVYGTCMVKAPVYQRYWKRRIDGVKQRYQKKTRRMRKAVRPNVRYEFSGKGRDLYRAVVKAHRYMPKDRIVDVSAEKFVERPEKYGTEGSWIESKVES